MPIPTRRGYIRGRQSNSATGTWSVTINRPAEAVEGDVLIVHMCVGTGSFTVADAHGWQQLHYRNVNTRSTITFAKRYDEDDPATYTIDLTMSVMSGAEIAVFAVGDAGDINTWTIGPSWRRQDNGGAQTTTHSPSINAPANSLVFALEIEATNAIENDGDESISGATKWFGSPNQTTSSLNIERILVSYIEAMLATTTPDVITTWPNSVLNGAGFQIAIPYLEGSPVTPEIAVDTFERTVSTGSWGTAEKGGTWSYSGSTSYLSVSGGKGIMTLPTGGNGGYARLASISETEIEMYAEWSADKIPTNSNVRPRFMTRRIDSTLDYHVRPSITPTGSVDYRWYRGDVAGVGSLATLPGTYTPGAVLAIRLQTFPDGAGVTRLRARMWYLTDTEPTDWPLNVTDATPEYQVPGAIGISASLGSTVDNGPIVVSFDNLMVIPKPDDATANTGNITLRLVPHFTQTSLRIGAKFINALHDNEVRLYDENDVLVDAKSPTIATSRWGMTEFTGLTPDTPYAVKFFVDNIEQIDSTMTVSTLPEAKTAFTVVAGSCQFTGSNHPIFTRMAEDNPLFIAHMGDLHYQDATSETAWRSGVESSLGTVTMRGMLATVPMSWSWDNHDRIIIDTLNTGSTDPMTATAWREIAGNDGWSSPQTMGRSWTAGRVRFIQTDQWTVRDDPDLVAEPKTFLGAAQKQWWKDTLLAAEEPVIIWFCQWTAQNNANGRWNSFNAETTELEDWLNSHPGIKERLIMIGGDSHQLQADSGRRTRLQGSRFNGVPSLNVSGFNRSSTGANGGNWDIAEGSIRTSTEAEANWGAYSRLTFNDDGINLDMLWEAVRVDMAGQVDIIASWRRKVGTVLIESTPAVAQYFRPEQSRIQPLSIEIPE